MEGFDLGSLWNSNKSSNRLRNDWEEEDNLDDPCLPLSPRNPLSSNEKRNIRRGVEAEGGDVEFGAGTSTERDLRSSGIRQLPLSSSFTLKESGFVSVPSTVRSSQAMKDSPDLRTSGFRRFGPRQRDNSTSLTKSSRESIVEEARPTISDLTVMTDSEVVLANQYGFQKLSIADPDIFAKGMQAVQKKTGSEHGDTSNLRKPRTGLRAASRGIKVQRNALSRPLSLKRVETGDSLTHETSEPILTEEEQKEEGEQLVMCQEQSTSDKEELGAEERYEELLFKELIKEGRSSDGVISLPSAKVTRSALRGSERKKRNKSNNGETLPEVLVDVGEVSVRKGLLTAVMGPSGAGKTTWIKCVVDQFLHNKHNCNSNNLRIGFVTQEAVDCFAPACTPKEVLLFHRNTRFREVGDEELDRILLRTRLYSSQNTPLKDGERNNLSGGERKKLAIALELLASPDILFLDEPLSGLDSRSATLMMRMLTTMTKDTGCTIVMSIHQPELNVWKLIDDVMVLKNGILWDLASAGRIIEKHEVEWHVGETPAEGLLRVVMNDRRERDKERKGPEEDLEMQALGGHEGKKPWEHTAPDPNRKRTLSEYFFVMKCMLKRDFRGKLRNKAQLVVRFLRIIILALIAVGFFWQLDSDERGIRDKFTFFFWCVYGVGMNLVDPLFDFITCLKVWDVERRSGFVTTSQFLFTQLIYELVMGSVSVNAVMATYFAADMKAEVVTLAIWWFILFSLYIIFIIILYFCSCMTRSSDLSVLMFFPVNAVFMFSGGFMRVPENIPWPFRAFSYISYYRFAIDGMTQLEFTPVKANPGDPVPFKEFVHQHDLIDPIYCLIVMLGVAGIVLLITYFFLRNEWGYRQPLRAIGKASLTWAKDDQHKGLHSGLYIRYCRVWQPETRKGIFCRRNPGRELLLIDDRLYIQPGVITGIMGPSGCGKSTLLNAISGQTSSNLEGEAVIYYGDTPLKIHEVGYVMQDVGPGLTKTDTPIEILRFHRDIRCKSVTDQDILDLLDTVGLSKRAQNNPIAVDGQITLSGGEKKKLAIAVALLATPKVLCLDEPFTGLDSVSATEITRVLWQVTRRMNVTVILTVHQPGTEVISQLDELIVMRKGGHLVAAGTREEIVNRCTKAVRSAQAQNLSEMILQWTDVIPKLGVLGRQEGRDVLQEKKKDFQPSTVGVRGNWFQLFGECVKREYIVRLREIERLLARLISPAIMTTIQCFLYFQLGYGIKEDDYHDRLALLSFYTMLMAINCTTIQFTFMDRLTLYKAEKKFQFSSPIIFYVTHYLAETVMSILISGVYFPSYWICNLNPSVTVFFKWALLLFLGNQALLAFLLLSAQLVTNPAIVQGIATIVTTAFFFVTGFARFIPTIPWAVRWLSYVSWTRYMYTSWVRGEYLHRDDLSKQKEEGFDTLVKEYYDEFNFGECAGIVASMGIIYHFANFIVLRFEVKEKLDKWYNS